jgi:phospholipid/cholesterol/gamma-HCH transport system ATP-binding protein
MSTVPAAPVIEVDGIVTRFGDNTVHGGVSFTVARGTLAAMIGGSGTGKSVLLREIIGLHRPTEGRVRVLGTDMWHAPAAEVAAVRRRFGMTFQDGALFSSLTVAQNVAVPLAEHTMIAPAMRDEIVRLRLAQAGLHADVGPKMPSELSPARWPSSRRSFSLTSRPRGSIRPPRAPSTRWCARWSTISASRCSWSRTTWTRC